MRAMGFEAASALACAAGTEPYRVGQLLNLKVASEDGSGGDDWRRKADRGAPVRVLRGPISV